MRQILCFGDSNTYGLVPCQSARYPWHIRWTGRVQERLQRYGYRVIEEGLCGRTTVFDDENRQGRRGSELLPVLLESHTPVDTVVLMLGTNDCKTAYHTDAEKIGQGIEVLLNQIRNQIPHAKILLISPIFLGEDVWKQEYDPEFSPESVKVSKQLGDVYERVAKKYNISFLRASDYAWPSEADREHFTEAGHKALADAVTRKLLAELLQTGQQAG